MVLLRPATPADAQAIAEIWHSGWIDGHLGHVPDSLVAARTPESFYSRALALPAVVAAVDGEVAGFIVVHDDEVDQVYVSGQHRGTAVAPALLAEAERLVAAAGFSQAWLAVVGGNARARRFYERHGWIDGGLFDHVAPGLDGTITVPAHRYLKSV
jgi:ribosomal protein S18 acetylase RimI-like enzyme